MRGIYSDQTSFYLSPEEPEIGDLVTVRLRIPKYLGKSLGKVIFMPEKNVKRYQHKSMKFYKETDYYCFFESTFNMPDRILKYHFEINLLEKKKNIVYDAMGVVENNRPIIDFTLIAGVKTPKWAQGSVYYQIFVDRFYNADETNDPVNNEYRYDGQVVVKKDWETLPHPKNGHREFYGGDLKGVLEKLDYLEDLGIETIYLNPIFVSPSPHKYDTQDYEHIDPHFGVIIEDTEDLTEKYKVRTTSEINLIKSDELFQKLVEECHRRNIKVVLDGVFNHCGSFHKWIDEMNLYGDGALNNESSPYRRYFYWNSKNKYEGWWGYRTLPKLNYGNINLWKYIADIGKKWVSEPFNVDGWRLDVADDLGKSFEMNTSFWRFFYKIVKKVNPDAVIFAEIYKSPLPWLERQCWDSIMNYITCMDPISYFLTGMEKHNDYLKPELLKNSDYLVNTVRWALSQLPMNSKFIALNQLSNHDHSRWITRTTQKVGRLGLRTHEEAIEGRDLEVFKIGLVMMFTIPGSPGLYYGDEIGLAGWTDPDNRRPYPWGKETEESKEIFEFTKELIKVYKTTPCLRKGSFDFIDWKEGYVAYASWNEDENVVTIINREEKVIEAEIPVWLLDKKEGQIEILFSTKEVNLEDEYFSEGIKNLKIPEKTAIIIKVN